MVVEMFQPRPDKLNTNFILGEIVYNINSLAELHPDIDTNVLRELFSGIKQDQIGSEEAIRDLCQVFQDTYSFSFSYEQLEPDTKTKISAFIDGMPAANLAGNGFDQGTSFTKRHKQDLSKHSGKVHHLPRKVFDKAKAKLGHHVIIYEDEKENDMMDVYSDVPFTNWALNAQSRPSLTFVPSTILGLQNLVKAAKGRRIRCSGYRHNRAPVFADDGDILVSMLPLRNVTFLDDPNTLVPDVRIESTNELRTIQTFPSKPESTDRRHVRVGAAVTAEELHRWAVADGWALPADVRLGEITTGGLSGSICHGSGLAHKNVNDYIRVVEYVDVNGTLQTITDPDELRAAAGCFGLLGIVTHITYEVLKMSYAVMKPCKAPALLAIPPVDRSQVPEALDFDVTDDQVQEATADFERRAQEDDYAEWAWFPYQSDAFVNTWSTVADSEGTVDYAAPGRRFLQWLAGWLSGVISSTDFFVDLPARWQSQFLATIAMAVMPPMNSDPDDLTIKTALPNAQHFRRGYQYMRVRDMELQIPIPSLPNDPSKPDWSVVRKAWWQVVNLVYSSPASPMRLTLELRIMGDSNIIMAPQTGNIHGTASIEIGTVPEIVPDEEWAPFRQKVCDLWRTLAPEGRVRPHWGKEWSTLRMGDMSATQYLKTVAYKAEILEFKAVLERIGKRQGWGLDDLQQRFSNKLWDELIFSA